MRILVILLLVTLFVHQQASAQVSTPTIINASFDDQGKLVVRTSFDAIEGCYVAINGGLSRKKVETGITSIQLTSEQADSGKARIKTKRKYYCKQRTLYINAELTCLNDLIGSATSAVVKVTVPSGNIRSTN